MKEQKYPIHKIVYRLGKDELRYGMASGRNAQDAEEILRESLKDEIKERGDFKVLHAEKMKIASEERRRVILEG